MCGHCGLHWARVVTLGCIRPLSKKILTVGLIALLFLLASPQLARAQTSYWAKTYGGTGDEENPWVQQTSDEGYIVVSTTDSFGAGDSDAWVVKLDGNGNIEWQRTYGTTGYDSPASVLQTSDGGYVVAGNTGQPNPNTWDAWVFKLDHNGAIQWEYTYGGPSGEVVICMQQTNDGGYIVGGRTISLGSVDFWVLKLDSNGNRQWDRAYGGPGASMDRRIESILQTSDGGYILAGSVLNWPSPSRVWVIKVDTTGDIVQWQKTYTPAYDADLEDMQRTTDGGTCCLPRRVSRSVETKSGGCSR